MASSGLIWKRRRRRRRRVLTQKLGKREKIPTIHIALWQLFSDDEFTP
jgi:hypothetical protein